MLRTGGHDVTLGDDEPLARELVTAIREGRIADLEALLDAHPDLVRARIEERTPAGQVACARTLLHVATDWPGGFPRRVETIAVLVDRGADPDAPFVGTHAERPLHWAASCDDVEAIDVLLDRGADIEAPGSLFANGPALADAVAFGQWRAARRLVERGATASLWQAAALGLASRVEALCNATPPPGPQDLTVAFWSACHGGQRGTAEQLLARGADRHWVGFDGLTPLDAAQRSGAQDVVRWLREIE
jgi:ankyrin repeat protein